MDAVEKWLDAYVKSIAKVSQEVSVIENLVFTFLSNGVPPPQLSEAIIDHDYTLLATRRYCEGAKEYWQSTIAALKKLESSMADPIRAFLQTELRTFKVFQSMHISCLFAHYLGYSASTGSISTPV